MNDALYELALDLATMLDPRFRESQITKSGFARRDPQRQRGVRQSQGNGHIPPADAGPVAPGAWARMAKRLSSARKRRARLGPTLAPAPGAAAPRRVGLTGRDLASGGRRPPGAAPTPGAMRRRTGDYAADARAMRASGERRPMGPSPRRPRPLGTGSGSGGTSLSRGQGSGESEEGRPLRKRAAW